MGTAVDDGVNCVQLTTTATSQAGAAWHECLLNLDSGFELGFLVFLGQNDSGADGMCFVLHQEGNVGSNLVGVSGQGMGYGDGPFGATSMAIEIDTYANFQYADPGLDHIAINTGATLITIWQGPFKLTPTTATLKQVKRTFSNCLGIPRTACWRSTSMECCAKR